MARSWILEVEVPKETYHYQLCSFKRHGNNIKDQMDKYVSFSLYYNGLIDFMFFLTPDNPNPSLSELNRLA